MTEDEAWDAEMEETNELLDFANNLDFQEFLDDFEVQSAIKVMKKRVDEITAARKAADKETKRQQMAELGQRSPPEPRSDDDETISVTSFTSSAPSEVVRARRERRQRDMEILEGVGGQHDQDWDSSAIGSKARADRMIDAEALELAEKVLEQNAELRQVHSKQSLAKLLRETASREYKLKKKMGERQGGRAEPPSP